MKLKIVSWIKKQVIEAGVKGIVIGLSGGVDSAVVSALAKQAVGKNNVLALMLPCHSQPQDLIDAKIVAKKLGIKTKVIDLSGVYDSLKKILPPGNKLAALNLKPRLRMLTLYYFANKLNYLVGGTGNKSELSVGYFTKHGDGATDILPIAGLLKKDVRRLARELGLPEHIITKSPTAGLWVGQTDEGEMGITYNELDDILERLEKRQKQTVSKHKVKKVKEMIRRSEHKRLGPKICFI
ncbi:MAG: NAD+ synthase [Candidatus Omnitrophica bacterium]|nr:NAD+ synthase [Candidatus Omnitrophota bacterium]MBU1869663.1 NAD+ synthase [Candidatus Omnitrophota bacterium]